jgi:tetratricopeptide (TPR) repeat protein
MRRGPVLLRRASPTAEAMGSREAFRTLALLCSRVLCGFFVLSAGASIAAGQGNNFPAKPPAGSSPDGFNALVSKAEAARKADLADEASRLYGDAVRLRPDYVEGWWYLGTLNYDMDRYPEGAADFSHVAGLKPDMALGWAMWGLCEFETKNYDRALVHLERADQLGIPAEESFYEVAKYHLALALTRAGRFEQAVVVLVDLAQRGKDGVEYREAMGLAGLLKPLLPSELPPGEREMVLDVGKALWDDAARRSSEIADDRKELLRKYPNTPEIHFLAGTLALASDSDQALQDWKAELAINPDNARALASIAGEYRKRTECKTALPYAERAVAAGPGDFITHAVLGQVLAEGGIDVPRAIHELEIARRLAPTQPQVHFALALAYAKAGRKEDAAKERAEFLKLSGPSAGAASKTQ